MQKPSSQSNAKVWEPVDIYQSKTSLEIIN